MIISPNIFDNEKKEIDYQLYYTWLNEFNLNKENNFKKEYFAGNGLFTFYTRSQFPSKFKSLKEFVLDFDRIEKKYYHYPKIWCLFKPLMFPYEDSWKLTSGIFHICVNDTWGIADAAYRITRSKPTYNNCWQPNIRLLTENYDYTIASNPGTFINEKI